MTFLNAILLAGAAAFLIPLIIHLLNRRRVQRVAWGAMNLLREALRQRKRNLKIEQLLLLLTRIAIPIVLALCLARPVLTWFRLLIGANKNSLLVLLDNSFSMRAPGPGGTARDRSRDDLRRILENLPRGSDANVILSGSPPRALLEQPSTILDQFPSLLLQDPSLAGPLALHDTFQSVAAELKRMSNATREVLLISDFQQSDWRALADGGTLPALEALKKEQPAPLVTFYRVAGDLPENLSVASVEPSAFVVAKGQTIALRTRLKNHGSRPYQDIAVHLEADGIRLRTTRVSVAPNAETVLTLSHAFDSAGDHALTVRIEGDSFPDDNAWSIVIPVREQVNCLLIGDRTTKAAPLDGPTDFLELALEPHQSAAAKALKDVINTTALDYRRFTEKSLAGVEVVILSNVEKASGRLLADLEDFVARGGGLIIFAGPSVDSRAYEQDLWKQGRGLLPCTIKGAGHVEDGQAPARILSQRHSHPATVYFNDARGLRLQDASFQHWLKFDRIEGDARVLLSLDRGDALMVEKPFGKGRVIAVASTASALWNNLPLQPVFVPLMQRLVTYLAVQSAAPQSQPSGTPLHIGLSVGQSRETYELTDPMNQVHVLTPEPDRDGNPALDYPVTQQPGIYELRAQSALKNDPPRRFAFHLNPAESDLTPLPPAKARETALRLGAAYAESYPEYERLDRARRHGSEVWQALLVALLGLLFFEVWLQQRISRA
jgi:hypothetical protein